MCGIVGFNYKDEKLVTGLKDMLAHRGPDQSGVFTDESVSLGHRRLSILDLSLKGVQPMSNEDGSVFIVFNGEIFNYKEIREDLIKKGHTFKSKTDTEVLVHLYEEKGYEMLLELNGQFSFCVYDKRKSKLFLARDRTGILPLFFYYKDNKFIFSSELKCVLKSGIKHEVDKKALTLYLRFGYIKAPFSILKNTYKLEAAHYLVFDLTTKTVETRKRYWDLKFEEKKLNLEDLTVDILNKIENSVNKRLMADVPVGAFLSGGIDSSIIVSMIKNQKTRLKTFSVRFDHKGYDESSFASKVAKTFGTEHYEIDLKDEEIRGIVPRLVEYFDEPFGDPSSLPTYVLAKIAAKHVKVCLSGDGGDEIFAGYTKYKYLKAARVLNSSPGIVKGTLKLFISIIMRFISSFEIERVFEIVDAPKLNDAELFERLSEKIRRSDLRRLVNYEPDFTNTTFSVKSVGLLNVAQNYDIFNYLDADILTKVDRASMASSLETRPPFLDHELVDMCSRINKSLRLNFFRGKWILREAFRGKIPEYVLRRPKHGFSVPIRHYLDNELKDMVKKYVLDYDGHNLFNKIFLSNIGKGIERVNKNRLYWNIMIFNMWHERWMRGV